MKKLFLTLTFLLACNSLVNAKTSNEIIVGDCLDDAWEWGTAQASIWFDSSDFAEYYFTNQWFEDYCDEDGYY